MTTSWAWLVRGHAVRAVQANAGGTLAALVAVVAAPWLLASAALGRWLRGAPREEWLVALAAVLVMMTLTDWIVRLLAAG
jgi:hypothetical protein